MKKLILAAALMVSATTAFADDWILRAGYGSVNPNDSSGPVLGNDGVSVDSDAQFAFSITYMFDKEWGVEVLGANPFSHMITGTGALAGASIGETSHLPPTISAVYNMGNDNFKYHVGVGINYTKFYEDYVHPDAAALGVTDLDLSASTGLALKAGFDMPIADDFYFSGGVYYMMISTDADVMVGSTVLTTVDVDIDPFVVFLGVGMTF